MKGLPKRLLMVGISALYDAVRATYRLLRTQNNPTTWSPVVLTYHAIGQAEVPGFSAQMQELAALDTAVFPDEPARSGSRRPVAVTFDDGFQTVFDHAAPILAQHRIPATVFVPTGYLGTEPGWVAIADRPRLGIVASADTLSHTDPGRIKIGSHSVTHPHLNRLTGVALEEELASSRRRLEEIMGRPVGMLSLPYGSSSAAVLAAARAAGYDRVFANVPIRSSSREDGLAGRIDVSPHDWLFEFRLKRRGAYEWMALALPVKRRVLQFLGRST